MEQKKGTIKTPIYLRIFRNNAKKLYRRRGILQLMNSEIEIHVLKV